MRASTRRRSTFLIVMAALAAPLLAPAGAAGGVDVSLPATVVDISPPVSRLTFPSRDYGPTREPGDDRYARTSWRVVQQTGNCCENYLTITGSGRLLDFGGSFINFSDDRGLTWKQVRPLTPMVNGEGAIVAGPDGDIIGVEWDPYSGDHLQFFKLEADTGEWRYTEMPFHQPFYDREWIFVAPGPITIDGVTHEYVSFAKGGVPKEPWFYSTDGLNYTRITSAAADQLLTGDTVTRPLPVARSGESDRLQANSNGGMTQLGRGEALASPNLYTEWALLSDDFMWSSYRLPDGSIPVGRFQIDSAGRVHNVVPSSDGASFSYRISSDRGRTWRTTNVRLPANHVIEEWDFRAHAAAGVGAVAIHAQDRVGGNDQDLVYKLDITGARAFVERRLELGLGDVNSTAGVGEDVRMDFQTVAIFDDGRVAASFIDSTTLDSGGGVSPAVAVELGTTLGGSIPPPEPQPEPELGERYASYSFESGAEGWTATGTPTWTRQHPGASPDGADEAAAWGYAIDGPTQYIDQMDSSLVSPPIATDAGRTVLAFWMKIDTETGFDYVDVDWRAGSGAWTPLAQYSGRNAAHPAWDRTLLAFDSPGGNVQVRFRFLSDQLCSALDPMLCGGEITGARVDRVVLGKQAP